MFNLNDEFAQAGEKKKAVNAEKTPTAKHPKELSLTTVSTTSTDDVNQKSGKKLRQLKGGSVTDYANLQIDHSSTLLADRYLCRGGGMFIVAPSGQGKSTLAVQLAAEWGLGWASLEIRPHGPLRTLIIQAEDDAGDVHEMSEWVENHNLSDEQKRQIAENMHIEPVNDVVGFAFIDALDEILQQWPCDIVIINPYTSYLGGDAKDEELANAWLRAKLNPLLTKHKCAVIIMHHTPKTQYANSDDYTTSELMYRGSGCATMSNWARAYMVLEPLRDNETYFKFTAAKRGKRIGWGSFKRYFKHSDNGDLRWVAVSAEDSQKFEQEKRSKGNRAVTVSQTKVLACVPKMQTRFDMVADKVSKELGIGINRAKNELNLLEAKGAIFYSYPSVQNSDGKAGRKSRFVAQYIETKAVKEEPKALL